MRRPKLGALTILPGWGAIAARAHRALAGAARNTVRHRLCDPDIDSSIPRRVMLTWALLTPIPLIFVSLALNAFIRRLMLAPSNARVAVVAGYNDVSVALGAADQEDPGLGIRLAGILR